MKTWLVLPLVTLFACSQQSTVGTDQLGGGPGTKPISTASLSEKTKTQLCPLTDTTMVPDLAPVPDGVNPFGPYPCDLINAGVGGQGACCGGDLQTQTCGPGLICFQPDPTAIGVCEPPGPEPGIPSVCISRWVEKDAGQCSLDAGNQMVFADGQVGCRLLATCGPYGAYLYSCEGGTCSCLNDNATVGSFPDDGVCGKKVDDALEEAQKKCSFPSAYSSRYTSFWK